MTPQSRVAILTVSDSVARGEREDASGVAVEKRCLELGWSLAAKETLPDEHDQILDSLTRFADGRTVDLILTVGGTGLGPRDVTPEATAGALEKVIPAFGERMRAVTGRNFPRAYLSRAIAGVRGKTLIVNLPGNPKGAVECLDAIAELLPHAVAMINGGGHD
jgi:molybdopterin adenylyltransferase